MPGIRVLVVLDGGLATPEEAQAVGFSDPNEDRRNRGPGEDRGVSHGLKIGTGHSSRDQNNRAGLRDEAESVTE